MTIERQSGKDTEGSDRGLVGGTSPAFHWRYGGRARKHSWQYVSGPRFKFKGLDTTQKAEALPLSQRTRLYRTI